MSNAIVINDVPEIKDEKIVREILNLSEPVRTSTWGFDCCNPQVISASKVRKEIKKRLETDVKEKGKYDLVFLCESGGTILCGGFEDKLREFGGTMRVLPYSRHAEHNWRIRTLGVLQDEMRLLNENPNIAIIESDAGQNQHTSSKLGEVIEQIKKIRPDARIRLIIGAANTASFREYPVFTKIKFSCCWKTNEHVLRLSEVIMHAKKYLDEWHEHKDAMLKKGLSWPERDKKNDNLEKILSSHNLYSTPRKKEPIRILDLISKYFKRPLS